MASVLYDKHRDSADVIAYVNGVFEKYQKMHETISATITFRRNEGKQQVVKTSDISFSPQVQQL